MFNASIYLHEQERFVSCAIVTSDPWEAQSLAEAIALCYGADVKKPDKSVFGIRPFSSLRSHAKPISGRNTTQSASQTADVE